MTAPTKSESPYIELSYYAHNIRIDHRIYKLDTTPKEDLDLLLKELDYIRFEINNQISILKVVEGVKRVTE